MSDVSSIAKQAAKLSPVERAELIDVLFSSFDGTHPELDAAWAAEAEDRLDAYARGELKVSPAHDVFKRIGSE